MKRGEVVSSVVLVVLGGYIVSEAVRWEYLGPDGPGPGFFPLWYGIAMVLLSLALLVANLMKRSAPAEGAPVNWREVGRVFVVWGGFLVSVALLRVLGFVLSFGLFVLFIVGGMYRRPWPTAIAVAVGCAVGFYLVFPFALNVRLPIGVLGF